MTALHTIGRGLLLVAVSFMFMAVSCPDNPAWADEGQAVKTDFSCYQCHSKKEITPWITKTWSESAHARKGVLCSDCHGNHDQGFDSAEFTALPGPEVCRECHPLKVKETLAGAHAAVVKCTSCHPRHTFSLNVAKNPMICSTCHSGDLHVDGYKTSKMGVIYMTEGPGSAATCQTCHMPEGQHDVSRTLKNRDEMLKICNECHSASFAGEVLKSGSFKTHW